MPFKTMLLIGSMLAVSSAQAADRRDRAILASPMAKAIQHGLIAEQGLRCAITRDESGARTIQYFTEDGMSKFVVLLLCKNGQSALIKGVIGDGGQTRTEEFKLTWAN